MEKDLLLFSAKVDWLVDEIRIKEIMSVSPFFANISFDNIKGLWSVALYCQIQGKLDYSKPQEIKLGILFYENMEHGIFPGDKFILSEASKIIYAKGEIIA